VQPEDALSSQYGGDSQVTLPNQASIPVMMTTALSVTTDESQENNP